MRYNPPHAQPAIERYVKIANQNGLDPAQMALAFVISRQFMTSAIIGATTLDQLKTNIDSADIKLSDQVIAQIEAVHTEFPDITH